MADYGQLQACKRCRVRKIKCDKLAPRCSPCGKANAACVVVDGATQVEYSRESIAQLEAQEKALRAACGQVAGAEPISAVPGLPTGALSGPSAFVGEASGISFLETAFSSPQWTDSKSRLLKQVFNRPQVRSGEPDIAPANLPSREAATYLSTTYLKESQWQKPFLLESEVQSLLDTVYTRHNAPNAPAQDKFRLLMICAIAAVPLRRRGVIDFHPYSFFLAACALTDNINILDGLDGIQNLLLIARFGVYFHTGISLWELARVCIRLCIELELHLSPLIALDPIHEQHQRRVFWECYVQDRYSSTTLGRPFAIADDDIEVLLPAPLFDNELYMQPLGSLDRVSTTVGQRLAPSPMDVFICFVRLRQITSRIHSAFFTSRKAVNTTHRSMTAAAEVYVQYAALLADLEQWRSSTPHFVEPECLYQRKAWYDFLYEKDRNVLVRGVIASIPTQHGQPPEELVEVCIDSATRTIDLFAGMYLQKQINCTRGYFQHLFTAGLSLMYYANTISQVTGESPRSRLNEKVLVECSMVLRSLSDIMTDAKPFSRIFDLVYEHATQGRSTAASSDDGRGNDHDPTCAGTTNGLLGQVQNTTGQGLAYTSAAPQENQGTINTDFTSLDGQWGWATFPEPLMLDMEAYAGQFACGDFSDDFMTGINDWDPNGTWDNFNGL
ncbi:hypothetical protein LTR56_009263 [Elasticomyces elasticus]|nr:hypothetical protein LTR56_009263 [Elasticomyces elasticus]KAK3664793.1 hypothetical protein LTR22_004383 [Elasticomyces elasticus]KAK4928603.1 hypothetical protein LTR49_004726 [Elasticomyces elasticus]KAK5765171.1 hypothetical protein LTS12_004685 [Elasticomyces elasticus]